MRKTCLDMVYDLAKRDPRIFFLGSDLGVGTLDQFKAEMPDRFFMEGVSEANVIGMAAGLALEGKIVYVNTIATFLTRRCFEQIVLDLCLHRVRVRLIGNGGGMVYAPLGPNARGDRRHRHPSQHPAHDDPCPGRRRGNAAAHAAARWIIRARSTSAWARAATRSSADDHVPFAIGKAIPMREGTRRAGRSRPASR